MKGELILKIKFETLRGLDSDDVKKAIDLFMGRNCCEVKEVKEEDNACPVLNAREALYGFFDWIISRKEKLVIGSSGDCVDIDVLIKDFCHINSLDVPENPHASEVKFPEEKLTPSDPITMDL